MVLAGGASARMGRPKALLEVGGQGTWLRRALRLLASQGAQGLRVAGGESSWVPQDLSPRALHLPDQRPGQGPLAGLESALAESPCAWVLVLPCDLPRADAALVQALLCERRAGLEAVVAKTPRGLEPLVGCYARALLPALRAYLGSGRRSAHGLLADRAGAAPGSVRTLELPETSALYNANTPQDLEELREQEERAGLA